MADLLSRRAWLVPLLDAVQDGLQMVERVKVANRNQNTAGANSQGWRYSKR